MSSEPPCDIPGTVQLINTRTVLNVEHGKAAGNIVLVPQPSSDPDDPLSWTPKRKTASIFWVMVWCFSAAAIVSGLSPAYLQIEADTGISVADLSTGNGVMFLFLGWGTLVTQTFALNYGRRPTLVLSIITTTVVNLWSAFVKSRTEFFVNRIIIGIVSSPMETLIEVVIDDLFFVHQRGFYMGLYSWTLWCGALLCPVVSGFVAEALGWRWIQYILSIMGGAVSICTFLFFEETMYFRPCLRGEMISSSDSDHRPFEGTSGILEGRKDVMDEAKDAADRNLSRPNSDVDIRNAAGSKRDHSLASKIKLWGFRDSRKPFQIGQLILPFTLFQFPTIFFAGVLVGGVLSWYNVVGGSLALILGSAPYNFSPNVIGLFYLASVIGVSIGCLITGWASDALPLWVSRRRGGVMVPEHRLWLFVVAIVAHPVGCFLYGVGASYRIHWIGIAFGVGAISLTLPLGTGLAFTYVLDSFEEVSGEGFVSIILIRNSMGFAFSYAVVPMIRRISLRNSFILIGLVGVGLWALCLVMVFAGKPLRRRAAKRYWAIAAKHVAVGQ